MKLGAVFKVFLSVLIDWRVIATVIGMIIVIAIARSIANYTKKPKKPKAKKSSSAAPAPSTEPAPESAEAEAAE